jgi:hypothetical protein
MAPPVLPPNNTLQMLIAALNSMGGGVNPNLMYSAYPAKVSPAGVKSAFDPEILFSSGLVTPQILNQLTASQLAGLQSKYSSDIQSRLPYEASDMVFAPITNKYLGDDDLSSFMRGTFNVLNSGNKSLTQVLEDIQNGYITNSQGTKVNIPEVIKTNFAGVQQDLTDYVKLAEGRNSALSKFQYDQQGKLDTLGPAPTVQDARMAMFKEMGVPQLGLLGDPNATYQFNPSDFVDKEKLGAAQGVLAQALQNQGMVRGQTGGAVQQGKLEQSYAMKAIEEAVRKAGDAAVSGMQQGPTAGDKARAVFGAGIPFVGGGLNLFNTLNNKQNDLDTAMQGARDAAMKKERDRLMLELLPTTDESARIKYSPEYRNALAQSNRARTGVSMENAYGRIVAETIARRLAEAGKTPFQQNMNDLLGYAIRTAK